MTDVVKFCTSDTLVKKALDIFFFSFLYIFYVEVLIEQIKMMKSFIGLAGLIFEINGKNLTIYYFFLQSKPQKDGIILRIGRLCLHNQAFIYV